MFKSFLLDKSKVFYCVFLNGVFKYFFARYTRPSAFLARKLTSFEL